MNGKNGKNGKNPTPGFLLKVKVEQRERYFAAITTPFAITAYGQTAEESEHRAVKAVMLLLNRHPLTTEESREFLRHRKVKLIEIKEPTENNHPVVSECSREMRLVEANV